LNFIVHAINDSENVNLIFALPKASSELISSLNFHVETVESAPSLMAPTAACIRTIDGSPTLAIIDEPKIYRPTKGEKSLSIRHFSSRFKNRKIQFPIHSSALRPPPPPNLCLRM